MRAVDYALAHARKSAHCADDPKLSKAMQAQWHELASAWELAAKQLGYFEHADTKTELAPSIVPAAGHTHYFVLDDFGDYGCIFHERREHETGEESVIRHLIEGQFNKPLRVFAFNTHEGWSRDVSEEIADKVLRRVEGGHGTLTSDTRAFVERHLGFSVDLAEVS
jgi:hypothetical protein